MRRELDEKLCADFPHLYRNRHADMRTTCMCWGFPGDGWEPLIRELSEKLQAEVDKMPPEEKESFVVEQVKEKFGTLRYYVSHYTDKINDLIQEAEEKSAVTCENCGAPGKQYEGGWILTQCDGCREKYLKGRDRWNQGDNDDE